MEILEVKHLSKYFEAGKGLFRSRRVAKAVDDVSFTISRGETFGLVGESGSGKSTLAKLVLRLYEPTAGQTLFESRNIYDLDAHELTRFRMETGVVFQDPYSSLNQYQTIRQILRKPFLLHNFDVKDDALYHLLETVGLHEKSFLNRYPHEFSGGQRQRIAVARAIALRPKFIVADEPTSMLDISVRGQILELLRNLQESMDLTYLFITHDLNVAKFFCNRIAVLYLGRIAEMAKAEDLFAKSFHPYSQALLAAAMTVDPKKARSRDQKLVMGDPPSPVAIPNGCRFHPRCPYSMATCEKEEPRLMEMSMGHSVACHLFNYNKSNEQPSS